MSKIDDGGTFFPQTQWGRTQDGRVAQETIGGVSLRDHFAGQPLTAQEYDCLVAAYFALHPEHQNVSVHTIRYFHADRMIAEKRRTESSPA